MSKGHLSAQRDRFDHPLFRASKKMPWCRGYAWDWMVAQAAWKDHQADFRGATVTMKRGQFFTSIRHMAEVFGWSKSSVGRFLDRLKTEAMIGTDSGTGQIVITICNYDKFQNAKQEGGTRSGTGSGTVAGQQRDNKNKGNKGNNKNLSAKAFEDWWDLTPRKVGKGAARKAFAAALKKTDIETLTVAIRRHAKSVAGKEDRFIPHPATWLNQERWTDEESTSGNVVDFGAFGTGEVVR